MLDPSIPLTVRAPQWQSQVPDPITQFATLAQIGAMQDQSTLRRLQAAQLGQTLAEQQQQQAFLRERVGGPPAGYAPLAALAPGAATAASVPASTPSPWHGSLAGAVPPAPTMGQERYVTGPQPGLVIAPGEGTTYTRAPAAMQNLGQSTPVAPGQAAGTPPALPEGPQTPQPLALDAQVRRNMQLAQDVLTRFPLTGETLAGKIMGWNTQALTTQKELLAHKRETLDVVANLFGNARDQPSWEYAKATMQQMGLPTQGLPAEYNAGFAAYMRNRSLSEKDKQDLAIKQTEAAAKVLEANTGHAKLGEVGIYEGPNTTQLYQKYPGAATGIGGAGTTAIPPGASSTALGPSKQALEPLRQAQGKDLETLLGAARGAQEMHAVLDRASALLDPAQSGGIYETGPVHGAAIATYQQTGTVLPGYDEAKLKNTIELRQIGDELSLAKQGGKVGAQTSNFEQTMIRNASGNLAQGGTLPVLKDALQNLRGVADRALERYNTALDNPNQVPQPLTRQSGQGSLPQGTPTQTTPAAPTRPASAAQGAARKVITTDQLTALAQRRGLSVDQVRRDAEAAGFQVR